jgi:hypothetical protein
MSKIVQTQHFFALERIPNSTICSPSCQEKSGYFVVASADLWAPLTHLPLTLAPTNEGGVMFLFAAMARGLGFGRPAYSSGFSGLPCNAGSVSGEMAAERQCWESAGGARDGRTLSEKRTNWAGGRLNHGTRSACATYYPTAIRNGNREIGKSGNRKQVQPRIDARMYGRP